MPYYGEVNANIAAEAKKAADARKADEEAVKKAAAQKIAKEAEAAVKKAAEELAAQRAAEELAVQKKAAEDAALKRAAEEAVAQKAAEEAAAILKAAEELAARKVVEEAAAQKIAKEAAAQKIAKEAAAAAQRAAEAAVQKAAEELAAQNAINEAAAQKAAEEADAQKAAEEADAQKTARGEYIKVEAFVSKEDAIQLLKCVLNIPDGTPIKNNNNNTYIEIKEQFTNKDENAIAIRDLYNLKSSFNDDIFDSLKTTTIKFVYTSETYIFLKACYNKLNTVINIDTDYYLDIVNDLALAIQDAVKAAIIERLTSLYNIIICFTTLSPQKSLNNIIIYTDTQKNNKLNLNSLSIICSNTFNVSWFSNEEYGIDLRIMTDKIGNINVQQKRELLTEIYKLCRKLFWPLSIITGTTFTNKPINVDMANLVKNVYDNDTLDDNKTRGIDTLMKYPLSLLTLSKVLNEVSALFTQHALQLASDEIKSNMLDLQKTNTLNKYFNITDNLEKKKFDTAVHAIDTFTTQEKTNTDHISLVSLEEQFNNMYNMLNTRESNTLMNLQTQYIALDNALNNVKFNNMIHDDILEHPQILSAITEATFVIINANITTGHVKKMVKDIEVSEPKLSGFVQVQESLKKGGFRKTKYKKYTKKINKSIRQISGKYTKIIGGFRNTYTKQYTKKKYKKAKNKKQLIHNKS